ncbi:MAG: hypothetical protein CALGDGBN_03079 [Pseudomonadales bacterium]|nr:hypothetical protein [Pseudomonadales bacterium]
MIVADDEHQRRFVARTAPGDRATVAALLGADRSGARVRTLAAAGDTLHFTLDDDH